jgi:serine/threonine-protein kinase RsbT
MMPEVRVAVERDVDVVEARLRARELATVAGFRGSELALIATAISELARNVVVYAQRGEVSISVVEENERRGIRIVACDEGPGIPDIDLAMRDGYSTTRSLGLGLPGARRLMDEFEIESEVGKGTTVRMAKWTRR